MRSSNIAYLSRSTKNSEKIKSMKEVKKQNQKINFDRERFSSFVVDLRQCNTRPVERNKKELKTAVFKQFNFRFSKLKNKLENFKPNLLKIEKQGERVLEYKAVAIKAVEENIKVAEKKIVKEIKQTKKVFGKRYWRQEIKNKQRILGAKIRIKNKKSRLGRLFNCAKREETLSEKKAWYRSILSFIVILFLLIIPIKLLASLDILEFKSLESKIVNKSKSAVSSLMAASNYLARLDFKGADLEFQKAGEDFLNAETELNRINSVILSLASLSNNPKIKLAAESKKFLAAGTLVSSMGQNLVLATGSLFDNKQDKFSKKLEEFSYFGHLAVDDANKLQNTLERIDANNLPDEYREKFETLSSQVDLLSGSLEKLVLTADKLKEILGLTRDKRYLLVFQNNSELRASGGFLGSYALVDIRDGKIRNLEVPGGGSYDTEAGLKMNIVAPEPLWLVNPLWHFWDANWWPDWPTTAKNLMWFYEKSDGPTVDGVISVTPTVVERLLEITGPIDLTNEYGLIINSENFWETVQKIVEQKNIAKTHPDSLSFLNDFSSSTPLKVSIPLEQGLDNNVDNKPKKIIGDLMAKILEILPQKISPDNLLKIISVFEDNMSEKQILFYFTDPELQAEMSRYNFTGEIKENKYDYLMVVNTNIAGQKSDRKMKEKIEHFSEVSSSGEIVNTLKIQRTHAGTKNEVLTGVRNVDWLRIYVPLGSELISANGFRSPDPKYLMEKPDSSWERNILLNNELLATTDSKSGTKIYAENNKTVFANWLMVDPGETVTVVLRYKLKINLSNRLENNNSSWLSLTNKFLNPDSNNLVPYSLLVQKQPGAKPSEFSSSLILPQGLNIFWRYPEQLEGAKGWQISDQLNSDKYYSVLLEKTEEK